MAERIGKKSRKAITLETKVKIIQLSDESIGINEIGRRLQLARSTIYSVLKDRKKYLDEVKSATPISTTKIRKRDSLIADMEKLLNVWINDQANRNLPVNQPIIQNKAKSLFDEMKAKKGAAAEGDTFAASRGWYERFKKRSNLQSMRMKGEAAVLDSAAAKKFSRELADIIDNGGYSKHQIFNVDETGLYWKKMPSRTFIAREELTMPGFKPAKDRLTLLLGANCSGNHKLKPMLVYNAENPRAFKNHNKATLPVYWRFNRKACVTAELFEDWFENLFVPEVEDFCRDNNIPFKILLILDNFSGHPRSLGDINSNVKVIFFPPNTTSLLQPMDHFVKAAFKHYYLRRTFKKCIDGIEREEGSGETVIKKFWKSFTILEGTQTIMEAWSDINTSTLQASWNNLCPQLVDSFERTEANPVPEVIENIVDMAKQLEIEVDTEDIAELMESHFQPLANEDLDEERDEDADSEDVSEDFAPGLSIKLLTEGLGYFETGMAFFEKHDPDFERSLQLNDNTVKNYSCYYEMLRKKKKRLAGKRPWTLTCEDHQRQPKTFPHIH